MPKTAELLHSVFGFSEFRPGQAEIVDAVLAGKNTLAIMPTGGGKSLCFQLPALCREGVTVVVSPLIALMRDQVRALREAGRRSGKVNGDEPAASGTLPTGAQQRIIWSGEGQLVDRHQAE